MSDIRALGWLGRGRNRQSTTTGIETFRLVQVSLCMDWPQ